MKPRLIYSPSLLTWCCHGDGVSACAKPRHAKTKARLWWDILQRTEAYKAWSTIRAERALYIDPGSLPACHKCGSETMQCDGVPSDCRANPSRGWSADDPRRLQDRPATPSNPLAQGIGSQTTENAPSGFVYTIAPRDVLTLGLVSDLHAPKPWYHPYTCPVCKGDGQSRHAATAHHIPRTCKWCQGLGKIYPRSE